ncbi:hypothetical protein XENTR_v10012858 [Xenopus tropicalis]|nr:hypothetical protein XENTR_v10012858 [Xenopus tropicalis]
MECRSAEMCCSLLVTWLNHPVCIHSFRHCVAFGRLEARQNFISTNFHHHFGTGHVSGAEPCSARASSLYIKQKRDRQVVGH